MRKIFKAFLAFLGIGWLLIGCSAQPALQVFPLGNNSIWPLAVGHSWSYNVNTMGNFTACSSGNQTQTVVSQVVQNGVVAFQLTSFCGSNPATLYSINGDFVQINLSGHWFPFLDHPLVEGHQWAAGPTAYTWHNAGTLTVSSGTYAECWTRHQSGYALAFATFCRGVGIVAAHQEDASGNGWDAQLVSKSF